MHSAFFFQSLLYDARVLVVSRHVLLNEKKFYILLSSLIGAFNVIFGVFGSEIIIWNLFIKLYTLPQFLYNNALYNKQ